MWYTIFMLVMVPLVAVGWLAYYLYMRRVIEEEKKDGRKESQRLSKSKNEVTDWAKKMAEFESPREKRKRELREQKQREQEQQDKPGG